MRRASDEVASAYRHCRGIQARHGRSFYRATCLLPPSRRPDVWALYAFTRVTDDLVDDPDADRATRAARLETWTRHAVECLRRDTAPDTALEPVLAATWHTMRRLDLPLGLLEEFFASMRLDLDVQTYPTWGDLQHYMRGSAAVIGELMAPVLGAGPEALPHAAALGEAFQLTNFVRDVREDLALGRVYLPQDDLAAHGVSVSDLRDCADDETVTPAVRGVLERQIERARDLYAAAEPGVAMLDPSARPCIRVAIRLYSQILVEIERAGMNVFGGRVVVPPRRRAICVARALIPSTPAAAAPTR